jgi:hypothetical protein
LRLVGALVVVASLTSSVAAEEPYLEFVRGLRSRGYYDTALEYLTQIADDPDLPPEVREVLPYERARTLLDGASRLTNSKQRREQLDAAQASFEQFVQSAPNHPLAGRANTEQARILVEKAKVDIWDAEDPANADGRTQLQEIAREKIQQARVLFQQALAQHEAAFRRFPLVIPEDEKARRRERDEAEQQYLLAKLDLAETLYYEAETYDRGSEQRKQALEFAIESERDDDGNGIDGFTAIHDEHRSQIVGLVARLWQGKCFEEMDMIREAVGIYNELLDHPGSGEAMQQLKARALRFKLICLNHESRQDYKLVIEFAQTWRQDAGAMKRTDVGMGILFEMCRAEEKLGTDRTVPETQRSNYLRQALANANEISRYPGELKAPALALARRVSALLGRPDQDPEDFKAAFGRGDLILKEVMELNAKIDEARAAGRTEELNELLNTLEATAAEMTRMFELALRLVEPETDSREISFARLQLAYGYFLQRKYYEAAAAADYAVVHLPPEEDELARKAAFLQLAAYNYAYNEAKGNDRDFEERGTVDSADTIVQRWPDSDYATDARNTIAKIHWNAGDKAQAGEWWAQVPPAASDYARSQVQAGQAYWAACEDQMAMAEAERVPEETLNVWMAAAETHLETGTEAWQSKLPEDAETPNDLALGKLILAQIRNRNGVYTSEGGTLGAIELLTGEPHSVVTAVDVPPGEDRPGDPSNVKSVNIAGSCYQTLLRAWIGVRNLDAAADARAKLEQVAAGDDSASLTQLYVSFGVELQREMEALRAAGETDRLEEVRGGFEDFLNSVYERETGQTYNSMAWIAETYTSLGEGSEDDPTRSEEFFTKAGEMYNEMLARAKSDPTFVDDPQKIPVIKLHLANCLRRQGDYAGAEEAMLEAVGESVNSPTIQFEAARLYQEWAGSSAGNADKYAIAISGSPDDSLWGYRMLGRRLQASTDPKLEPMRLDVLFNQFECYLLYSREQTTAEERDAQLDQARLGIETFMRITAGLSPEDYRRFNSLYQEIRSEMGLPAAELADVRGSAAPAQTAAANGATRQPGATQSGAGDAPPADEGPQSNLAMIVLMVIVGLAAVVGLYFLAIGQDRRRHRAAVTRLGSKRK